MSEQKATTPLIHKVGARMWHLCFGWCTVVLPNFKATGRVLVELEADEIEYYEMGTGRVKSTRSPNGTNYLSTPPDQLLESDTSKITTQQHLKRMGYAPTVTHWDTDTKATFMEEAAKIRAKMKPMPVPKLCDFCGSPMFKTDSTNRICKQRANTGRCKGTPPPPRPKPEPKTGRNDPCPCGSGRKFKHCHLNK